MSVQSDRATALGDGGEQSRRSGIREGAFQAIMLGGGESYLSAFALLFHASAVQIGLLSALPQLIGTGAQLLSVKVLHRFQHRKGVILAGAAGQSLLWLPLLALPLIFPEQGAWLLIVCAVVCAAMGHFAIPAWNSLLTDLVDPNQRGAYWGYRARVMAVCNFAALCAAGLILHSAQTWTLPWMGFAVIFIAASAARAVSTSYLARIDERSVSVTREDEFRLWVFLRHTQNANFRRFLLFSGLMHGCALIAGPYFVVYMLRDLAFSYLDYSLWLATGVIGQFVTLKSWGRMGDRYGNKKVVTVTAFIVPFLPMLYLFSENLYVLLAINVLGGATWAGFGLGLQNYVFDAVRPEDRAKGVAIWNNVNAVGWFAGAMIGSWLAGLLPGDITLAGLAIQPASNLPFVFFISGMLRLVVSLSLIGAFHEARNVEPISPRALVSELPLIKPLTEVFGGGPRRDA